MKRVIKASTSDAYQLMLEYISRRFRVNGPEYRGARMPDFHKYSVNESEFGDGLRVKYYECEINGNELDIQWITQEPFIDAEVQALIREIERCVDELYDDFCKNYAEEWLTYPKVNVEVISRDGEDRGYYKTSFGG